MKKIVIVGIILTITSIESYKYLTNNEEVTNEITENTNMLTMMLETEDGNYVETTVDDWPPEGYVFNAELSKCENGGIVTFNEETKKINMQTNISDKCYVYFDIANQTFANYIIEKVYTEDGVNGLYYHDGVGTYTNASEEAGDNSYRYSGANPNNYACFGSDAVPCPSDNLYRIIGIFDDDKDGTYNAKLIKDEYMFSGVWDLVIENYTNVSNTICRNSKNIMLLNNILAAPEIMGTFSYIWSNSTLNKKVNGNSFFDSYTENWINMIENTFWKVNIITDENIILLQTIKNAFNNEIRDDTLYEAKIGLIYVSDYGYAASPENWQTTLSNYEIDSNNNWLFLGEDEWTITAGNFGTWNASAFYISKEINKISSIYTSYQYGNARPVFYLKSDTIFVDGNGTVNNPYRLSI